MDDKVYIIAYLNVSSLRGSIEKILYSEDAARRGYDKLYKVLTTIGCGIYDRLYLFETTLEFIDEYELDRQVNKPTSNDIGAFINRGNKLGDLKILEDNCLQV